VIETIQRKHRFDMVHGAQKLFRILLEALANPGRVLNFRAYAAQFAGQGRWLAPAVTLLDQGTGFYWDGDAETGEEIRFLTGAPRVSLEEADFVFLSGEKNSPGGNSDPADHTEASQAKAARILARVKQGTHLDPHDSALLFIRSRVEYREPARQLAGELQGEASDLRKMTGLRPGSTINFLANDDVPPFRAGRVIAAKTGKREPGEVCAGKTEEASVEKPAQEQVRLKGPGIPPDGRTVWLSPVEAAWCRARDRRGFEYPCGVELVFLREDDSLAALTRKTEFRWA
jgi:alpha-D-ribose 1-methylphosphonate 5-triphosphate synthase subunit PhnH